MKQQEEDMIIAQIEDEERVYDELEQLSKSRQMVAKVMDKLPGWVTEMINGPDFTEHCAEMFTRIDADGNGVLDAQELYPLIVELLNEHPISVTEMHCQEFVEMFDNTGRGVIGKDDFKDFVKFTLAYEAMLMDPELREAALAAQGEERRKRLTAVHEAPEEEPEDEEVLFFDEGAAAKE